MRDIAEVLDHPQVLARGMVREVDSPVGPVPVIANPIKMSGAEPRHGPIPSLGGDTDDVLRDADFADDEIASMRAHGAVA